MVDAGVGEETGYGTAGFEDAGRAASVCKLKGFCSHHVTWCHTQWGPPAPQAASASRGVC